MNTNNYDANYIEFHLRLLNAFVEQAALNPPFCLDDRSQADEEFLSELKQLPSVGGANLLIQGQELLCKIVAGYPQLMVLLPRDLLWFFGGDCLHFMPDDEIALFQTLDEQRHCAQETNAYFL